MLIKITLNKYFVSFIDDYTHHVIVYLIKNKSEVFEKFKTYFNYATRHFGTDLLKLRADNGGAYITKELQEFCNQKGISIQYTVKYNPEMNGVAERMNRTVMNKTRTLLIDSKLSKELWGEAVYFSVYVTNRSPTTSLKVTPFEMWNNRKPNVSNFRVFGSITFAHIPKQLRSKLDPKGKQLRMVGYAHGGYRLWDEEKQTVTIERNVIFSKEEFDNYVEIEGSSQEITKNQEIVSTKELTSLKE